MAENSTNEKWPGCYCGSQTGLVYRQHVHYPEGALPGRAGDAGRNPRRAQRLEKFDPHQTLARPPLRRVRFSCRASEARSHHREKEAPR